MSHIKYILDNKFNRPRFFIDELIYCLDCNMFRVNDLEILFIDLEQL